MGEAIIQKKYREKSWNYIAPGKHDLVNWCMESWEKLSKLKKVIQAGCNATYMNLDLDKAMAKFDNFSQLVGEEDDFDRYDWVAEVQNMDPVQRYNLMLSPFHWRVDLSDKSKRKKWT